jgi:hypothetical protein
MSSEIQKVIRINPELFKIPTTSKTKKNIEKKIKVKGEGKTLKNVVNKNILNHIRTKQNELFNEMVENSRQKPATPTTSSFQSDFDKALQHMDSLVKPPLVKPSTDSHHNKSIKNRSEGLHNGGPHNGVPNLPIRIDTSQNSAIKYGCLVGGQLPTYRKWKNSTPVVNSIPTSALNPLRGETPNDLIQNIQEIQQTANIVNIKKKIVAKQPTKQKKTVKRTYHVGKSKYYPKIGVLISNRTLRTQTLNKTQQMKQTPITEIRKTLVKKGLIKVGSTAPNDVLRKMYESVSLMVGDVQNHNVETLLHNYIAGSTTSS